MSDEAKYQDRSGWNALVSALRRPAVLLPALAVVTFILYSGTLFFQFVWDDKTQIVNNPIIRSMSNLHRVFISDLWYHAGRFQLYYRPFFVVWSILNYAAVGLHAWGWHLGAILMHVAASMAVFWLVRKLGLEYWTAAIAAFLFALHPIHIECVAWISAASDSMVTLLVALSFIAFINVRERGAKHRLLSRILSLVLFACALLTKEIALGFAMLVAVYEWLYPVEQSSGWKTRARNAVVAALPYAALTIGYLLLRKIVLHHVTGNLDATHSYADMVLTLPYVLAFYLWKLIFPLGLTGLYYTPYITEALRGFIVPVLVLSALVGLIFFWSKKTKDPVVVFAAAWIILGLAPALHLRGFGNGDFVRDRYIYLGSVGFALLVAKGIRLIPTTRIGSASAIQGALAIVLGLAYVVMSVPQQAYWDSDLMVFLRGYTLYPQNPYTEVGLAREYSRMGAYDRAMPLVEDVIRKDPHYFYSAYALADVYISAGRKEQGRAALLYAQRVIPDYLDGAVGGVDVAAMWGKLGDYDRAIQLCSRVLAQEPGLFSALYNCGNVQLMAGHYGEAEQLLRRALQTAPELAGARHFLGRALFLDGNYAEAHAYLAQAAEIDPKVYDYHYWLGRSLEQSGDKAGARREYVVALHLNQDSAEAKQCLAALEEK